MTELNEELKQLLTELPTETSLWTLAPAIGKSGPTLYNWRKKFKAIKELTNDILPPMGVLTMTLITLLRDEGEDLDFILEDLVDSAAKQLKFNEKTQAILALDLATRLRSKD